VSPTASTWRLVSLFGTSLVWLLLSCLPALAHATLLQETPAAGARLDEPPEQVQREDHHQLLDRGLPVPHKTRRQPRL